MLDVFLSFLLLSALCAALTFLNVAFLHRRSRPANPSRIRRGLDLWLDRAMVPIAWAGLPFFIPAFILLMNLSISGVERRPDSPFWHRSLRFAQSFK